MTYKKSSVSKAVRHDFINCLKTEYIFPLISALITVFLGLTQIIKSVQENQSDIEYALFGDAFLFYSTIIIYIVALLAGVITGIRAFAFLRKVPSTNVYLSLPITRYDLYANRVLSSVIYFAGASILPILILGGLNYAFFKPKSEFIQVCIYFMAYLFVAFILGFAISSLVSVIVGKTSEARFFSLVLLFSPLVILLSLSKLQATLMNGAALNGFSSYASSELFNFSTNIYDDFIFLNPFSVMFQSHHLQKLLIDTKFRGFDFNTQILPLIVFGIIALILLVITPALFEKRLAENADAVGVSKGLTIFTAGLFAFFALSMITGFPPFINKIGLIICAIIASVIVYFVTYTILTRSKKKIVKCLKSLPIVAVVSVAIICGTVGFGKLYYSKVPNVEDINSAYAVASGSDMVFKTITLNTGLESITTHDTLIGKMTDKDDIKLLTDVHKQVTKELYKGDGTFKVVYFMNDGSIITRAYYNIGSEATKQTYKLYDTKAYNSMLKYFLTVDEGTYDTDAQQIQDEFNKVYDASYPTIEDDNNWNILNLKRKHHSDNSILANGIMYLTDKNGAYSTLLNNKLDEQQLKELKAHLYNDISKMNYEQKNFNNSLPVYYLSFVKLDDYVNYESYQAKLEGKELPQSFEPTTLPEDINLFNFRHSVPIYSTMTETLDFLSKHNLAVKNVSVNDILKAEYSYAEGRFDHRFKTDLYLLPDYLRVKDDSFFTDAKSMGLLNFYSGMGYEDLTYTTTDKTEIEQLYHASISNYAMVGDNGLIGRFTTSDGHVFTTYITESNIPQFIEK